MAWRIHDSVIRGEIDNRRQGSVSGRIWLKGISPPVVLQLKGNAAPDLAGCLLAFENTKEPVPVRGDATMAPIQIGTIGDLTASRKVRVFDIPLSEVYERHKKNLPVPEHLANCLYLEWFSEANGRVVIESTDYQLTISPPAWRLTPDQESQRREQAASGFMGFMQKLNDTLASKTRPPKEEDKEWDEFDYERLLRESDARTDKYLELLDKYMDHPDRDRIVAREMGWDSPDDPAAAEDDPDAESAADAHAELPGETDAELFAAAEELEPDPATEGVDWVRDADGSVHHPLCLRALERSVALWQTYERLGLDKNEDDDLCALLGEYQVTSAKLAGALNGLAYGRDLRDGAFIVACLKRALGHLHATQAALERVAPRSILPEDVVAGLRADLFSMREEILRLMVQFRGGRNPGEHDQ